MAHTLPALRRAIAPSSLELHRMQTSFPFKYSPGSIMIPIAVQGTAHVYYRGAQISALEWVYEQRTSYSIASVNMSLGGTQKYTGYCDTNPLKSYIDNLRSVGVATVISSGNSGFRDGLGAPACISSAISVGATSKLDDVEYYSNVASFVSLLAPGSIWSSVPGDR